MGKAFLISAALFATVSCAKSSVPQQPAARTVVGRKIISGGGDAHAAAHAFKDPVTGKLRQPTEDEAAALQLAAPPAAPSKPLVQTTYSDGSTSVELNEDYTSEVTVERAPDGTLTTHCETRNEPKAPALETK